MRRLRITADFSKDPFLKHTYLTESSQLQLEALCRGRRFGRNPARLVVICAVSLTVSGSLPFIDLQQLMDFSEDLLMHCFRQVLKQCAADLSELDQSVLTKLQSFTQQEFARMSYDQAIE